MALVFGLAAALAFPVVALAVHHAYQRRSNRRAGRRRTQKIRL